MAVLMMEQAEKQGQGRLPPRALTITLIRLKVSHIGLRHCWKQVMSVLLPPGTLTITLIRLKVSHIGLRHCWKQVMTVLLPPGTVIILLIPLKVSHIGIKTLLGEWCDDMGHWEPPGDFSL